MDPQSPGPQHLQPPTNPVQGAPQYLPPSMTPPVAPLTPDSGVNPFAPPTAAPGTAYSPVTPLQGSGSPYQAAPASPVPPAPGMPTMSGIASGMGMTGTPGMVSGSGMSGMPGGVPPMPGPSPAGYQAPPSLYPGMGQSYQSARPSSNTGLIVAAIVAGVLLLSGLGLFAARNLLHSSNKTAGTSSQSTGGSSSSNAPTNTAATTDDYNVVCTGSAISNAATYSTAAPRPIALFEKGSGGNVDTSNFETSSIFLDNTTTPDYTQPQKIQLVGCLSRNGNGSTVKTCNLQDSNNKTVSLKIMNAPYTLDIYVAKTGKKLGSSTISQTDTSCPFFAAYDPSNPVYYATPDDNAVKVAVQTYTQ